MTPAERRVVWLAKCLLAAVENALRKAEGGRLEEAYDALLRVEGITIRAKASVAQAMFGRATSGRD